MVLTSSILIFSDETSVEAELVTMLSGSSGASVVRNQSRVESGYESPNISFRRAGDGSPTYIDSGSK